MVGQRLCTAAAAAAAARCNICRHRLSLSRCRLSAIANGRQQTILCLPAVARCAAVVLDGGNWGLGLRPWPLCVEPAPHMHCPSVHPAAIPLLSSIALLSSLVYFTLYDMIRYDTIRYAMLWFDGMIWYGMVWYGMV